MAFSSSASPLRGPVVIACDNKAAILLCTHRKQEPRVMHIDSFLCFARDHVASHVFCKSEDTVRALIGAEVPIRTLLHDEHIHGLLEVLAGCPTLC